MSEPDRPAAIPVAALPEVGSAALAAALAARDVPAIGQALRHDFVVVPILRPAGDEAQNRVFPAPEGSVKPYELCLFSSAQTLAAYLTPEAPAREFALRRGTTLVPFLERHAAMIERVVFDPAGPHPVAATPQDVLLTLAPQPGDDDVAWLAGGARETGTKGAAPVRAAGPVGSAHLPEHAVPLPAADPSDVGGSRAIGFDLNLPEQWAVVRLDDERRREAQVRGLVRDQTRTLGDRGARLRRDLRDWLERTGATAAGAGGRLLAFLLQRTDAAAVALSLVVYWHELGPEIGGQPHLERIAAQLEAGLADGDTLVGSETVAGPFLRHSALRRGSVELDAEAYPLLVNDYWLAAPGGRGVVRLSFSTPHVAARAPITLLTDNVVFATAWVLEPSEPTAS